MVIDLRKWRWRKKSFPKRVWLMSNKNQWDKLKCKWIMERKWDTMPTLKWEMSKHWRMTSNEHMTQRNTKLCDILCNKRDHTKIKWSHDLFFWKWPYFLFFTSSGGGTWLENSHIQWERSSTRDIINGICIQQGKKFTHLV